MTGKICGQWTVVDIASSDNNGVSWNCICSCGRYGVVKGVALRNGHSTQCKSCSTTNQRTRHGHAKTNNLTPTFRSWLNMRSRCLSHSDSRYKDYGGRGITVCDRWKESFEAFLEDMGLRPSRGHSIERVDNNGHYDPGNCRWATRKEQQNNRKNTRFILLDGDRVALTDAARSLGVRKDTLRYYADKHQNTLTTDLLSNVKRSGGLRGEP
jgi:hypothetical protein